MTEEKRQSLHEVSSLLCEAYKELVTKGEVAFALQDEQIEKIDSIVKTVYSHYYGITRFATHEEKAAAYFCLIIKDHPVTDGNKRLATLWLQIYVTSFNLRFQEGVELDVLAVSVENEKQLPLMELVVDVAKVLFG